MRIGVLGAGQLGRMLALAGYPLDMTFSFYDTSGAPSAGLGQVFVDPQNQQHELDAFLAQVDLVTYEFEHLPLSLTQAIEARVPLYPSSESIRVCQNRELEKALFTELGIPTPAYRIVESAAQLEQAARELGCPVVAKSITEGYDGKGQAVLKRPEDALAAWDSIRHPRLIVEAFVNFSRELSIIAVRGRDGAIAIYPMAENSHYNGILRYSVAPAPHLDSAKEALARDYIHRLIDRLGHVGVLTLELFETADGLLANEMAPRVHNSGHWTQNGCATSQFENHVRAIAGLPLGDCTALKPTCMINLIGRSGDKAEILALPFAHLHLYGKQERPGRKLGHINILAESYEELMVRVRRCASLLPDPAPLALSLIDPADRTVRPDCPNGGKSD